MDGFIPHFNEKATVNLESGIIRDLVNRGECSNCDWFGVFSWKSATKLGGFDFERLKIAVDENEDCDLLVPNPRNYICCSRRIKSPHKLKFKKHKFMEAFDPLIKKLGISETPSEFMTADRDVVYYNYFIGTPQIYSDYVNSLLIPAIKLFQEDKELYDMGMELEHYIKKPPPANFTRDTGLKYYPRIPFILERLINVYIEINDVKVGWVL